jgi:hypothetical protein
VVCLIVRRFLIALAANLDVVGQVVALLWIQPVRVAEMTKLRTAQFRRARARGRGHSVALYHRHDLREKYLGKYEGGRGGAAFVWVS